MFTLLLSIVWDGMLVKITLWLVSNYYSPEVQTKTRSNIRKEKENFLLQLNF